MPDVVDAAPAPKPDGDAAKPLAPDAPATHLLARHPTLYTVVGWISVVSLVLGYLSGIAGNIGKIKQSLFERVGYEGLASVHEAMLVVTVALLAIGYGAACWYAWRRFISRQPRGQKWLYACGLVVLSVVMLGASALAALPPPPDIRKLVDVERTQWQQELLRLDKPDGGLRSGRMEPTSDSQVWSTAQALTAVLSSGTALDPASGRAVRAAFEYIQKTRLPKADEGWGYFAHFSAGISEINAWVCVALAKSLAGAHIQAVWGAESSVGLARLVQCVALVTRRQMPTGAWAPINRRDNDRLGRTYSTLMSLWALLEARAVVRTEQHDAAIRRGADWLLQQYDDAAGGWVPNPYRKPQLDSFPGLTAHAIYVLSLLPKDFDDVLARGDFQAVASHFDRWLDNQAVDLRQDTIYSRAVSNNDRTHDADRYLPNTEITIEGSTFLWYPWMLNACSRLHPAPQAPTAAVSSHCRRLAARAGELVKFAKQEPYTYVMAEALLSLHLADGVLSR
jgi:hypothetical protein